MRHASKNLPIGAVSVAVVLVVLRVPMKHDNSQSVLQRIKQLDLIGASLLIPAIVCLLLALQWGGNKYPWSNSRIIGLFVGFGLIIILFIFSQLKLGEKATLPPRILKQRTIASACLFVVFFGGCIFGFMYYLPIFFQSVRGSSATKSGIQVLPLMLSTVLASIICGGAVTAVGYYTPFLIISAAISCIGAGLVTTFNTEISTGKWIGYQILLGFGTGAGFQVPMTAVQTVLSLDDIALGSAAIMFFQNLGGSLFISVSNSVFQNGLIDGLKKNVPDLDPSLILKGGATQIRPILESQGLSDHLKGVVLAYMDGLRNSYRVSLALMCLAFVASLGFEWKSVKKGEGEKGAEPAVAMA